LDAIVGVGLMNQILAARHTGTSGVDWNQAMEVIRTLVFSPIVWFVSAAAL